MTLYLFICLFFIGLFGQILGLDGGIATGLSLKNLFLGLCIVSIVASLSLRRLTFDLPLMVFGPLFAALAFASLSVWLIATFSLYPNYSVADAAISLKNKLIDPLLMLLIGYFAANNSQSAIQLVRTFVFIISAGCALTIVDAFNIPDLGLISAREEDGRIQGFVGSAAEFSTIVAATIPILLYGTGWTKGTARFLAAASALLMVTCLLLAATRAPFLGLFASWIVYALLAKRSSSITMINGLWLAITTVAFLTLALQYTVYSDIISDRFLTGMSSGNVEEISSGRSVIWKSVLLEMWERPSSVVTGMGWDVYFQAIGYRYATHNIFLDRFYSLGAFGLLLFVIAYFVTFRFLLSRPGETSSPIVRLRFSTGLALVVLLTSALFADLEIAEFFIYAFVGIGLRFATEAGNPQAEPIPKTVMSMNAPRTFRSNEGLRRSISNK